MSNHEVVHKLVKVQKAFMRIKTLSASPEIDRLCISGISDIIDVGDSLHPDLIKEFNQNHADVMA